MDDQLDDPALRAIRRTLLREFPVRRWIYWCDFTASAAATWLAVIAATAGGGWLVVAMPVAVLALLRAAYFIHELAHVRRALPGFELAWNAVIGCWIGLPSFMVDAHRDHHRIATYGTALDPEYEPVASWSRVRIGLSVASMVAVPPLLVFRHCLVAPLSWLIPPLRRVVWQRLSTLQTNQSYVRSLAGCYAPRALVLEAMATIALASLAIAVAGGHLPTTVLWAWWATTASALIVNQVRTLIAHGYVAIERPRTLGEQVADSHTAHGWPAVTGLFYPVGTRFHAIHHLAPQLPYHALAAADRRARELIGDPVVLLRGDHAGILDGVAALWRRAAPARRAAAPSLAAEFDR